MAEHKVLKTTDTWQHDHPAEKWGRQTDRQHPMHTLKCREYAIKIMKNNH
jgi:hypothetical protein